MKKFIIVFLVLAMVFSVIGCTTTTEEASTPASSESTASESTASEPAASESVADKPVVVLDLADLNNEYYTFVQKGAQLFCDTMGYELVVTSYDTDSATEISNIKAVIAKYGDNCVINSFPNSEAVVPEIASICEEAGVYFCTSWAIPADMKVDDYDHWVSHLAADNVQTGYLDAIALFDAMGGSGKICSIDGLDSQTNSAERHAGLVKALEEYPDIELLDSQNCDWSRTVAMEATETWLTKYNNDIDGFWASNDEMALGAIEALRNVGLNGQVFVVGCDATGDAVDSILAGDMVASVEVRATWTGAMGSAMLVAAHNGDIVPSELDDKYRAWYYTQNVIDATNAQEFKDNYITGTPASDFGDFTDYFGIWESAIPGCTSTY
jgi:ribose transport system substrate-binding protein